jgi:hypothetical protein
MNLCRAWFIATCLAVAATPAAAQMPAAPQQPMMQPQQMPPCVKEFLRLRDVTEKRGKALQVANERHAAPREACNLFNVFTAAEAKLLKYAEENEMWCGIPANIIASIKQGHAKAMEIRAKVCRIAANGGAPAAQHQPTLSDALGAPVPDSQNIRTGRGTFDTLTGTPLGK